MDEFSERLELAFAARTRGDLDPLLRDLPADAGGAVPATTSGTAVVSGGSQGKDTHWNISPIGGIRHRGHWRVPRHTVRDRRLGRGVDVDLGEAELAAAEVMITKVSVIGGVSVRVPPGMRVEVSNFSILGGRDINLGGPLAPNAPVLRIRSFSVIGGVKTSAKAAISVQPRQLKHLATHLAGPRTGTLTEAGLNARQKLVRYVAGEHGGFPDGLM